MYLTYDEYTEYGGTLDETTFDNLEFGAESLINYYTFSRLKNDTVLPTEVKRLTKYLIDLATKKLASLSLGSGDEYNSPIAGTYITAQSNDGVSVSYNAMGSSDLYKLCGSEAKEAIFMQLDGVMNELGRKLLYRGLYPGE